MNYRFTLYGTLWSGDKGSWNCEKTARELEELVGDGELNDDMLELCAKKLAVDFLELIDFSVDTVEIKILPLRLMSDENFQEVQDLGGPD